jgi:hypothetical protein
VDYPISVPSIGLVGGKFVDENPVTGTPGSLIPSQWGNGVTDEILNVITAAGLVPSEVNNAQLVAAIRLLNKQPVLLSDTGAANAYTAVNSPALTALPPNGYVQRVVIAHSNTGPATYAPDGLATKPIYGLGLQPLQGGELPVGIVVLKYLVQSGVNGGNGAWVIINSLGGASQVAPAVQSQHAIQLGQAKLMFSPVVGLLRNGKMTVPAASVAANYTADELVVETALGGQSYRLVGFNKNINLSGTGVGQMDTGAAPLSGYVALYAIYNPSTQASGLLAVNATASVAPEVYGGSNMPAGYTASALLTVVPTTAAGLFNICTVRDRKVFITVSVFYSGTSVITTASTSIAGSVPQNAKEIFGQLGMVSSALTDCSIAITANAGVMGQQILRMMLGSGQTLVTNYANVPVDSSRIVYLTTNSSSGTTTFNGYINGYSI